MKFEIVNDIAEPASPLRVFRQSLILSMKAAFNMTKQRCYNPNCRDFKFYGGRGIKICDRWLESFDNFLADMGLRPEGLTLERLDVDGDYSKENCVWATRREQVGNRRGTLKLTVGGETKTLNEWATITGINYATLKARKQRLGYSDEDCLGKSVKFGARLPDKEYKARKVKNTSKIPRGFDSRLTRFTKAEVLEIQRDYDAGGQTFSSMSRRYGGTVSLLSKICQKQGCYADLFEAE